MLESGIFWPYVFSSCRRPLVNLRSFQLPCRIYCTLSLCFFNTNAFRDHTKLLQSIAKAYLELFAKSRYLFLQKNLYCRCSTGFKVRLSSE